MEEVGDLCHACVAIVYEGIEEAGGAMQGGDIIVGDGGRDEGAGALAEENLVASAAHSDLTVALDAHGDYEAIVFA